MGMVFLNVCVSSKNVKSDIQTKGKLDIVESLSFYLHDISTWNQAKEKSVNAVIIFYQLCCEVSYEENTLNGLCNLCGELEAEH